MNKSSVLLKGIIKENPVLVLLLGTCPTIAITYNVMNALGMAVSAAIVLICSNIVISLLRNLIPANVRIPCYIVIIAGFVTIVQMLCAAYFPAIYKPLELFISLIVVNCIILGRAEMYASKNTVLDSFLDAVGMAIGFAIALVAMASIREIFGSGSFLGFEIPILKDYNVPILSAVPPNGKVYGFGGFFVFAILIAIVNKIMSKKKKPKAEFGCGGCPMASTCSKTECEKEDAE